MRRVDGCGIIGMAGEIGMNLIKRGKQLVCDQHGEVAYPAWLPCWNGCDDGYFDGYDDDPLWYDEGDMEVCGVCLGEGGWSVCPSCNLDNPDIEF